MTSFASKNPLLKNITDYLVDEADAEEEELLGIDSDKPKSADDEIPMGDDDDDDDDDDDVTMIMITQVCRRRNPYG